MLYRSRGMVARIPGCEYQDQFGNLYTFKKCITLPMDGRRKASSRDELKDTILSIAKEEKSDEIKFCGVDDKNRLASIVVFMTQQSTGLNFCFIRNIKEINENNGLGQWREKDFHKMTGLFRSSGKSFSENLLLKPKDIVGDEKQRNISELEKEIYKNIDVKVFLGKIPADCSEHLKLLVKAAANNLPSPILINGAQHAASYSKYLGEIIAPIAFVNDWLLEGEKDLAKKLFEIKNKETSKISYYMSSTNYLVDSAISDEQGSRIVRISSKSGSGAATSFVAIFKMIEHYKKTNPGEFESFKSKYAVALQMLSWLETKGQIDSILELGFFYKIINEQVKDEIKFLIENQISLNDIISKKYIISKETDDLTLNVGNKKISEQKIETAIPAYSPGYHALSSVAKLVTKKFNNDDFLGECIKEILFTNQVIQISSKIKTIGNDAQFESFYVKCPFTSSSNIQVDSYKNYFTTTVRGKLSFRIR